MQASRCAFWQLQWLPHEYRADGQGMDTWKTILTDREMRIATAIEGDISCDGDVFSAIARRAGTDEATVLEVIQDLKKRGIIRRFGAVLRHQRAGFTENALVVWAVPDNDLDRAGSLMARRPEITHCYERRPPFQEVYTLFTMVHGGARPLANIIKDISSELGTENYLVLKSEEEFKKASMRYFQQ